MGDPLERAARIEPHDLLPLSMDGARKNARLGWSSPGLLDANASRIDAEFLEELDQLPSFRIIPTMPMGKGTAPRVCRLWTALAPPPGTSCVSR